MDRGAEQEIAAAPRESGATPNCDDGMMSGERSQRVGPLAAIVWGIGAKRIC